MHLCCQIISISHMHGNLVGDPAGQWWLAGKLLFLSFLKVIRLKRLKKYTHNPVTKLSSEPGVYAYYIPWLV